MVPSTGYVCRLCTCYLRDLNGVALHCQTAAHYINYTTMTKMKDATLSGKKRGIDQVKDEGQNQEGIEEVKADEENGETDVSCRFCCLHTLTYQTICVCMIF